MGMFARLLGALPRNMSVPVIVLMAGWYGGAKYGAPDYVMTSIDGMIQTASETVGGFLGNESDAGATEDTSDDASV